MGNAPSSGPELPYEGFVDGCTEGLLKSRMEWPGWVETSTSNVDADTEPVIMTKMPDYLIEYEIVARKHCVCLSQGYKGLPPLTGENAHLYTARNEELKAKAGKCAELVDRLRDSLNYVVARRLHEAFPESSMPFVPDYPEDHPSWQEKKKND